ncbi:MAG: hypothetical protein RML32_08570, partial [Gammaproteobacteria bacterium]|nr:hypothetical protein [Gammaproteobacteria bacterium]
PLNLTDQEIDDLVAFMESLTSPQFMPKRAAQIAPPAPPGSPAALARAWSLARAAQANVEPINDCATPGASATARAPATHHTPAAAAAGRTLP